MKLKKKSAIVVFILFFALSISYAQEKEFKNNSDKDLSENTTVKIQDTITDKKQVSEKKTDIRNDVAESVKKKKTLSGSNKSENQKNNTKEISENPIHEKNEGDVLLINEGSFKYKRIPDIKIIEKKVEPADIAAGSGASGNTQNSSDSSKMDGFFGLGKTASDIIVKGGVLLLILLIFILYKSRMAAPGGKSSKSRKVLNSFRK